MMQSSFKQLKNTQFGKNPIEQLDWIYNNLSYYSAFLIFLKSNEKEIPETHLGIIGDQKFEIPKLNHEWIEILLDFYLYKERNILKPLSIRKHLKID
ncbi:MAG: hypothetical protein IPL23_24695 [Saprospiraceae bacterium]|nr:hypothetical protein [Saprospiraceae bacterium]